MKRLLVALLLAACSSLFTGPAFAQTKTNRGERRGTRDE